MDNELTPEQYAAAVCQVYLAIEAVINAELYS
jgi:hypothetical protein